MFWYRLDRYVGTDSSATLVPIQSLRWYRLSDTIKLQVLTDESANENGTSCFKKIPICCKLLGVDSLNIREYLELVTDGKLALILSQE